MDLLFQKKSTKQDPKKTEKNKNFKSPNYVKALRIFLGLAYPLHDHLMEGVPNIWTEKYENAFKNLKITLCSHTCIAYFDDQKKGISFTCAGSTGVSAILI